MGDRAKRASIAPVGKIEQAILLIRGQRVILDADLAQLYGVETKRLNEQVKRNIDRFPEDFTFQLTAVETEVLRSQIATSKGRGGRRSAPYAFTEHGAIMAATVLNSPRAVQVSVYVVRAFVRLRRILDSHAGLARELAALERKYDAQFKVVFNAIRQLMAPPPEAKRKRIGFATEHEESRKTPSGKKKR